MATIQSQLKLNDGMTSVLRSITTALDTCLSSFEQMQAASGQAMDVTGIAAARAELFAANSAIDEMEASTRQVEKAQSGYNSAVKAGHSEVDTLLSKVKGLLAAAGAGMGIQKILGLSDDMAGITARLSLVVDDGGSVADLEAKIFASAQRARASYQTTADTVAKLRMQAGDAFANNDEVIAFTEQLNKSFVIAGANSGQIESVMYNLTQALSTGVLRGQDLNVVMSNAMPIVQNIADSLGVSVGEIREMATEGKLSAGVIKRAMLAAAEQTNATFEQIPMTWGQLWTVTSNAVLVALEPLLQWIGSMAGWIHDNWSTIAPVFYDIALAVGALAAAFLIWKGVTLAQTAAQWALNSALLACPVTWIVLAIIAIAAAFILLWDNCEGFRDFFINAWSSQSKALARFYNETFVPFANGIINVQNKLMDAVGSFAAAVVNMYADMCVGAAENLGWLSDRVREAMELYNNVAGFFGMKTIDIDHAFSTEGINSARNTALASIEQFAQGNKYDPLQLLDINKVDAIVDQAADAASNFRVGEWIDSLISGVGEDFNNLLDSTLEDVNETLNGIEENTGSTAASLKNMSEEFAYMRDWAEREAVNRVTEIKVDMTGMSNRIDSNMDVDGIITRFVDGVAEKMSVMAEGVHS